ncbi:hypothetical protein Tco_0318868 [Tanacetum coccineum]
MNLKLLRSLPSEWKTHALIWRNKQEIETISLDDLYNNLNTNTSSSIKADNTAYGVSAAHTQSNPTSEDNLKQIDPDDLEEIDLQWEMAMLTIRARRSITEDRQKLDVNGKEFELIGLESVEARLAVYEESINVLNLEVKLRDNALVENKKKLEKAEKERDELKLTLEKFQNSSKSLNNLLESQVSVKFKTGLGYNAASSTAASPAVESFVNSSKMLENQEYNKSKSDKGYHAVPPPYTGNFIPFKPDLTVESNHESAEVKSNGDAVEPKTVRKNRFRPPVIEDWNSDDDSEVEFIPNVEDKTVKPSTKKINFVKSARGKPVREGATTTEGVQEKLSYYLAGKGKIPGNGKSKQEH